MTFVSQNVPRARVLDPVALLVDGENLSSGFAAALLDIAQEYGVPTVRRVYGKAEQIAAWEQEGFRLVPSRQGKNAADLLLCVEAMSLALRDQFHTLLVASSDRDFVHLFEHLRELGHEIIGIGEPKTQAVFRRTCTNFVELRQSEPALVPARLEGALSSCMPIAGDIKQGNPLPVTPQQPAPVVTPKLSALDVRLQGVIGRAGVDLVTLGNMMRGTTVREQTKCATWRAYLKTKPGLFRLDGAKVFCCS